MAKRFSELGIKQQDDRKIFNCQQGVYHGRSEQRNRSYRLYPRNENTTRGRSVSH